jgi:hypothetical protein
MALEDITGRALPAIDVFSLSIRALKEHLIEELVKQGTGLKVDEIQWVLTVPAIWSDSAKQFMRASAEKVLYVTNIDKSEEESEDTTGVIRIRISKNRQHNGQKKKYKRTNNDLQNMHIKLQTEKHEPH